MIDLCASDTIEGVRKVLGGLDHTIKLEIALGIPLTAKTAWDLPASFVRPANHTAEDNLQTRGAHCRLTSEPNSLPPVSGPIPTGNSCP
jgi:hypothetical protein